MGSGSTAMFKYMTTWQGLKRTTKGNDSEGNRGTNGTGGRGATKGRSLDAGGEFGGLGDQ